MSPVEPNGIYTTAETQEMLKISTSTIKRLLKKGIIRANKVGGQYRILGREILRSVSPVIEGKAIHEYKRIKRKAKEVIKDW
jgi:excisionase family DNA binding protein